MIISREHEFIFIKTRKTASSSMEIALSKYLGPDDTITPCMPIDEEALRTGLGFRGPQNFELPLRQWRPKDYVDAAMGRRPKLFSAHASAQKVSTYLAPDDFRRYRKILTIRNPYSYVVSLYNWHARRSGPNPAGFKSWLIAGQGDLRFTNYGMGKVDGRFAMDLVLQFETLVDGAERLARELDLPSDFPAVFQSIRAKSSLAHPRLTGSEAYGLFPQARELVESRFREEITNFGYVFPY